MKSCKLRLFSKDSMIAVDEVTVQIPSSYQMGGETEGGQELLS